MSDALANADTIPALLRARAELSPDAMAFSYEAESGWREINWRDFWQRVRLLASGLRRQGLQSGEHVGILAPTGLAWELFHHAILSAGGVVVGLESHDTAERLQWIADHADLRMLVVHDDVLLAKLTKAQIVGYRSVILLDGAADRTDGNLVRWADLEAAQAGHPETLASIAPDSPATLIYTSGTTGQSKGILYRHEQTVLAVQAITQAYPSLPVGARFVCWLPLSNLFQRVMNLAAVTVGGTVFLVSNPFTVLKALPIARPDVFIGVPRFYEKLHEGMQQEIARKPRLFQAIIRAAIRVGDHVARNEREGRGSPSLLRLAHRMADTMVHSKLRAVMGGRVRFMVTGSAPTPMRLLEFFHALGLPLFEAYGMSENVVPMALNRPGEFKLGTVGKPFAQNTLRLEDDGELLVSGPGVFSGYFKDARPNLFTSDGYYRTGDYADIDADGYLRLKGRKSEIIKTSTGRRISPIAIEAALQEVPGIDRAVVLGAGRKCLSAILTITDGPFASNATGQQGQPPRDSPGTPDSSSEFVNAMRTALAQAVKPFPDHEQPAGYLVLRRPLSIEAGELTPNLKLRRNAIEDRYATQIDALYDRVDRRTGADAVVLIDGAAGHHR